MKKINIQLFTAALLSTAATPVRAQEGKVMQIHSGGNIVYEAPASQVDSVTFRPEGLLEILFAWNTMSSCQWANLEKNKLTVINSNEELEEHIVSCTDGSYNYFEIDFSKHSLLLVWATTPGGVANLSRNFLILPNKCVLEVEIMFDFTAVASTTWMEGYIVDKISPEIETELSIIFKSY